jgi:hypothetical protein
MRGLYKNSYINGILIYDIHSYRCWKGFFKIVESFYSIKEYFNYEDTINNQWLLCTKRIINISGVEHFVYLFHIWLDCLILSCFYSIVSCFISLVCIYVRMYVYVCVCVYVFVYIHIYVSKYVHTYICIYVCMYVRMYWCWREYTVAHLYLIQSEVTNFSELHKSKAYNLLK